MSEEKVVMYESPEATSIRTVTGWVDPSGRFWGNDEHAEASGALSSMASQKTGPRQSTTRFILLNERALHALRQARRPADLRRIASKSATPTSPFVFQPGKGGMWIREPSVTIKHFKLALKALGIRERRQYDTRHTYATMCLMAGMNPAFIANQLGHSVEMLLSTYAKWISSSSDWRELEKLPASV